MDPMNVDEASGAAASGEQPAGPSTGNAFQPSMMVVPPPRPENQDLPVAEMGVLDLTGSQLHSLDAVELEPSLTELDLTLNRLKTIDPRVLALTGLTSLSLRQNLLTDASAIGDLQSAPVLQQLVFHDNQLTKIPSLGVFSNLARLELSYNEVRNLEPLSELADAPLTELFVANNKVSSCNGIQSLTRLQVLELGSNRIKKIEHIEDAKELKQIWLGRNRIDTLQGFPTLLNLTIIALPSNRLTSMQGLEACVGLEEIYLSHNGIQRIEGVENLTNLKVLDIATNMIERVEGLNTLTQLTDLWLNDNKIVDLDGLTEALVSQRTTLTCIYLENNPLHENRAVYRATLLGLLPNLEQLDSNDVVR